MQTINLGSSGTVNEYVISLLDENNQPVTVYGGTLTIYEDGTGELVADRVKKLFTGATSEVWQVHSGIASWFYIDGAFDGAYLNNDEANYALSNLYSQYWYRDAANTPNMKFALGTVNISGVQRLAVKDTRFTAVADFKTELNTNNLEFVYKLATPVTYTLTAEQITTLLGENNVWTDTGDTEITYRTNTETSLFVQDIENDVDELQDGLTDVSSMLAPVEQTNIATKNYTVGELLVFNGSLCTVSATIASGDTLAIGTNLTATNVENAINDKADEVAAEAETNLEDLKLGSVSILTRNLFPVCKKNISVNTGVNLRTADVIYNYFRSDAHDNLTGTTYRTLMLMSGRVGKSTTASDFAMYRTDFKPISSSTSGVKVYARIDRYRIDGEGTVTTPPRMYFASYDANGAIWWKYLTFSANGYAVTDYALDDVILTNGNLGIFVQFHRPTHGMEGRLEVFVSNTPDLPVATTSMAMTDSGFTVQDDPT